MLKRIWQPRISLVAPFVEPALLHHDFYGFVMTLFGYPQDHYNYATLRAGFHGLDTQTHWLCADPLSITLDVANVYAASPEGIALNEVQAAHCVADLNSNLSQGYQLVAPTPKSWYLGCQKPLEIEVAAPISLCGRSLFSHLPQGKDGARAIQLFNELQMLLHSSAHAYQLRAVWLWGQGKLIVPRAQLPWQMVMSDDPVVLALAALNNINYVRLTPELDLSDILQNMRQRCLIVDTRCYELSAVYRCFVGRFCSISGESYRMRNFLKQFKPCS